MGGPWATSGQCKVKCGLPISCFTTAPHIALVAIADKVSELPLSPSVFVDCLYLRGQGSASWYG